jgi:transcriptional regulator with XRE-family HTH domain
VVRDAAAPQPVAGLGDVIQQARVQAGLNQYELADALGIQQSSVSQWERGATTPTLAIFRRMAEVMGPWPLLTALLQPTQDTAAAGGSTNQQTEQPGPQGLDGQRRSDPMTGRRQAEEPRPRRPRTARPPKQDLAGLIDEGLSDRMIGQRYEVSASTVRVWRRQYQLHRRSPAERPPKQELVRLIDEGLSDQTIGDRYGVSAGTVANWRRAYQLPRQQRVAADPAQAMALWRQGLTISEIAERLGRSHWTIRRLLQHAILTYQATTRPQDEAGRAARGLYSGITRKPAASPQAAPTGTHAAPSAPPHHPDEAATQPAMPVGQPTPKERV